MLTAVKGTIKGNAVVLEDDIAAFDGRSVIVTILDATVKKTDIDFSKYSKPSGRSVQEIDNYVKELREDDRF